ncbi:MAG TPA: non-ribosomal peptide synthetase, partial [Chitinophaga sp.]|uniref:non-ribosomal peptide synthetase n=1 Tax=Chitinophaga sp. TaxID=1869181 RepID=UPI002DBAFFD2
SGSTGHPKGVQIEHGSLWNYLHYCLQTYYRDSGHYRVPLFTSLSFDLTVTSILGTLVSGGELVVYGQDQAVGEVLNDIFRSGSGMNLVKCTPAHIELLQGGTTDVSRIIVGGEELKRSQVLVLQALNADIEIYNEYGPTESTVGCIVQRIGRGDVLPEGSMPIGRPVGNTYACILDENRQLVPVGVSGELYIGGSQLARGYLNRAELTAQRFIADPLHAGGRLYRTGDVCRWRPDGVMEYLGRADDQVKINGYRIELGEIEHVLLEEAGMVSAVVQPREGAGGDKYLVGYLVSGHVVDVEALRRRLLDRLPEYMVPCHYVQLDKLPLTTNGKVDKRALPAPDITATATPYLAPRNEVEQRLVEIWKEVMGTEKEIGVRDNFFELGGHSIKAIKILFRVSKEFGVVIGIQKMFEEPTIENLANKILNTSWALNSLQVQRADNVEYEETTI